MTKRKVKKINLKTLLNSEETQKKLKEIMGKNAKVFGVTLLDVVKNNEMLSQAEPNSVLFSAVIATALGLPINPNLGFAWIVPYKDKKSGQVKAQFQLGYKGFIQLAIRSGQYQTISASPVYEGQIIENDPLKGIRFGWDRRKSNKVIGYVAYFRLNNGFEKYFYMSIEELKKHGLKYSQSMRKGYGLWKDDFHSMAMKTVVKLLLSKWGLLSVEMQKALVVDQAVINDWEGRKLEYIDNQLEKPKLDSVIDEKEKLRVEEWIQNAKDLKTLQKAKKMLKKYSDLTKLYKEKGEKLLEKQQEKEKKNEQNKLFSNEELTEEEIEKLVKEIK